MPPGFKIPKNGSDTRATTSSNGSGPAFPNSSPLSDVSINGSLQRAKIGAFMRDMHFHELQNPLSGLWGMAGVIREEAEARRENPQWAALQAMAERMVDIRSRFTQALRASILVHNPEPGEFDAQKIQMLSPDLRERHYELMFKEISSTLAGAPALGRAIKEALRAVPPEQQPDYFADFRKFADSFISAPSRIQPLVLECESFCKAYPGEYIPDIGPVRAAPTILGAIEKFNARFNPDGKFNLVSSGLHNGSSEFVADADPKYLQLILSNLLSNARKNALQETEEKPLVGVSLFLHDEKIVVLQISNNGPGVDAVIADSLFELGVSGGNSTGLGLYFCREAAREMGGELSLVSQKPAVFELTLNRIPPANVSAFPSAGSQDPHVILPPAF